MESFQKASWQKLKVDFRKRVNGLRPANWRPRAAPNITANRNILKQDVQKKKAPSPRSSQLKIVALAWSRRFFFSSVARFLIYGSLKSWL